MHLLLHGEFFPVQNTQLSLGQRRTSGYLLDGQMDRKHEDKRSSFLRAYFSSLEQESSHLPSKRSAKCDARCEVMLRAECRQEEGHLTPRSCAEPHRRWGGKQCKYLCEGGLVRGYPKPRSRCSGTSISGEHTRCAPSQVPPADLFKTDSLGTGAQACGFEQVCQMIFLNRELSETLILNIGLSYLRSLCPCFPLCKT